MSLTDRIKVAVNFLADCDSYHCDDRMSDDVSIREFVGDILQDVEIENLPTEYDNVVEALASIDSTWGGGFDMASSEDLVTDDETIGEIFGEFLERHPEAAHVA